MRAFDAVLRALGRLRLWQQFAALGLFAVVVPIALTTQQFSEQGRRILVAHETIDLADEANLRVNEIRDEFNFLLVDVAQEARALIRSRSRSATPGIPEEAARDRLRAFAVHFARPPAADKPLVQARRQYMAGTLVGAYIVPLDPAAGAPDAAWEMAPGQPVGPVLAELAGRVRADDPSHITRLHPDPTGERCLVGAGWAAWYGPDRRPTHVFAVVIDFTAYMRNRQATSPRHYYFVADAAGRLLVGPDRVRPDGDRKLPAGPLWDYTPRERELAGDAGSADRRKAAMLRNGGVTLAARPVPELTAWYVKGPFAATLAATHPRPADAEAAAGAVNALLAAANRADPLLRYGELTAESKYVELSHPDEPTLRHAAAGFAAAWQGAGGGGNIEWSDPLECVTYQGQLTYLNLDPNAPPADEPPRLVVAASTEELSADIDARFAWITRSRVVPVVAAAGLLTVGLVFALTLSIGRLARTAQTLADPATPAVIDAGGSREVTLLADALAGVVARLRDTAARFQTILRTAGEGVVVATRAGVIEEANRAAARMFGYDDPRDLAGVPVLALVAGPINVDAVGGAAAGQPGGAEVFQGVRRDGSTFWLEANLRVVDLQDRQVVTGVFRDVTQRRAAEEEIKQLNADLESRVAVRTAELAEANTKLEVALRQAEAAGRAKDAFVANMSHELRQPLHIIIGFTEALKEEAADAGTAGLVPDLDKILAAARHLLDLINDILDLAKIAAGKMELAPGPVDLARLVDDVRDLVGPLAEKNANAFVVDAPPGLGTMTADGRRVRQMLLNLLSNAFKFTARGTVTLAVRKADRGGRRVVEFAVADTGKGMSAEERGRLFQRFYQADDATTRVQGGTGLGLAITQSFNEVLGGEPIEVTSEEGKGSRFVVRLPEGVAPPAPATTTTPPPAPPPPLAAGETVLVIDDDPAVRELMSRFLAKEGFRVVEAATGADGLQLARDLQPAAVTLDVMMPGVDGWAVLADLKADPATADIPVVMLTIVDDCGRGYALGAADYLTKPIDWPRLAGILKRYRTPAADRPVLVVDDDAESRRMIRRFLEREGWRVTEAADGDAGLLAVAADRPGLVLLDLMMPVLDGFGFLTELPKRFPAGRPPVVVLTAKDLTADDFDRLNGRVTRILEKGDLAHFDSLAALVRAAARKGRREIPPDDRN